MRRPEKIDESGDDARLDDLLNGWIALLAEELSELGGSLDLLIDLVGENALNHLRKVLVELKWTVG
jgi:hypothetical protein